MGDYINMKQGQFKTHSSALTMPIIPAFPSQSNMSVSGHYQTLALPPAYNFNMESMQGSPASLYSHPQQHHLLTKIHSHHLESDDRSMNQNFSKPPVTYSFQPSCTSNGFFNSDIHKHTFDDVLNSPPAFNIDSSMNAESLSKLSYHQAANTMNNDLTNTMDNDLTNTMNNDLTQYSQETSTNYTYNLNIPHELQLAEQHKRSRFQRAMSKSDSDTHELQPRSLSQSEVNNCNTNTDPLPGHGVVQLTEGNQNSPIIRSTSNNEKTIFKCGYCQISLISHEKISEHLIKLSHLMPFQCGICHSAFIEGKELIDHVATAHILTDPYACGLCPLKFYKTEEYKKHMESHLQVTDVQSSKAVQIKDIDENKCIQMDDETEEEDDNENFTEIGQLSELKTDSSSSTILIGKDTNFSLRKGPSKIVMDDVDLNKDCTVIVEPSSAGGLRKKHLFKCNYCEKICKYKGSLVTHIRTHTKGRPYQCNTCHATFKQYAHLSDHVITKHTKERPFVCDRCAKTFNRKSHLQDHIRLRHTEDKLYHCSECSASFEKRADFSEHRRTHGKSAKHQCNICSRQFRNVTDYERHIRSHTKEKRFECEVCHLTFGLLANAKKHMIKHSEKRPYKCDICPKAYHFEHDYKRHRVTHLQKKPFPCPDCYKSFKNEALLIKHAKEAHMKLEEDPVKKPFKCLTCRKGFRIQWDLERHTKIHAKKKPFPCRYCYKTYGSESMLSKHSKVHSGQSLPLYDHSKDIIEDSDDENKPTKKKTKLKSFKETVDKKSDTKAMAKKTKVTKRQMSQSQSNVNVQPKLTKPSLPEGKTTPSIKILLSRKSFLTRKLDCPDCSKSFISLAKLKTHSHVHRDTQPEDDDSVDDKTYDETHYVVTDNTNIGENRDEETESEENSNLI